MTVETETIARLLARGFNEHIRLHGPDGDHAGEAAETGGGHSLVVTRDGAQYAVRVEPLQAPPSLGERIASVLREAGFREWQRTTPANLAAFVVAEGVGATVNLSWEASGEWRRKVLVKFAEALRAAGFEVDNRARYLYVHEPKRAEASCICPPGIRASGGFRTGCPADHPSDAATAAGGAQ